MTMPPENVLPRFALLLLAGTLCCAPATAASILVAPPATTTPDRPSIVTIAPAPGSQAAAAGAVLSYPEPAPATAAVSAEPTRVSPSVVAIGEPGVSYDKVAAISIKPAAKKRNPYAMPMVIRGGITEAAGSRPISAAPVPQQASAAPAPEAPAETAESAKPVAPAEPPPPTSEPE
jgi:hypothetical protein